MSRKSHVKANEGARTLQTMRHFRNNNRVTPQNSRLPHSIFSRHSSPLRYNLVSPRRRGKVTWSLVLARTAHIFRMSLVTHSLHPSFKCAAWTDLIRSQRTELVDYVRIVRATSSLVPRTRLRARRIRKLLNEDRALDRPTCSFSSSLRSRWNL